MSKRDESDEEREKRLAHGYERMLERVRQQYDGSTPENKATGLQQALDWARDRAIELGELSRDEARIVGTFLWRDLEDAGTYLARTGRSLRDWLQFDLELAEAQVMDMLMSVADQTRLEWLEFNRDQELPNAYHTGEMTAGGTLLCDACGEHMRFTQPGHIPPCPKCRGTKFYRRAV